MNVACSVGSSRVMPGLGPGIHACAALRREGVDGRPKAAYDGSKVDGRAGGEVKRDRDGYVDEYDRTVKELAP